MIVVLNFAFFQVPYEKRLSLSNKMNRCQTKNEQSVNIASMIQLHTVAQRTTKSASRRSITFGYTIKLSNSETAESASDSNCLDVCKNAFIRLLGISAQNLRYVQQSLKKNGMPPVDRRGKNVKSWKLPAATVQLVIDHFSSYKGENSLKSSKRIDLLQSLNKSILYRDFKQRNPHIKISLTSYIDILK